MRLGPWEIILIIVVILLIFGARRIPEVMRSLGLGMKEFRKAAGEESEEEKPEGGEKKG